MLTLQTLFQHLEYCKFVVFVDRQLFHCSRLPFVEEPEKEITSLAGDGENRFLIIR